LAKQDASIAVHYVYDAYGNVTSGDTSQTRYLFTGREFDTDIELQYNRARWYDPDVGRWISADPLGFAAGDANDQRYVGSEVTGMVDPSGLWRPDDDGLHLLDPSEVYQELWRNIDNPLVDANPGQRQRYDDVSMGLYPHIRDARWGDQQYTPLDQIYEVGTAIVAVEIAAGATVGAGYLLPEIGVALSEPAITFPKIWFVPALESGEALTVGTTVGITGTASLSGGEVMTIGLGVLQMADPNKLPSIDATGKVHGELPRIKDLRKYDPEDLEQLLHELRRSVKERLRKTIQAGHDPAHGERMTAEHDLIEAIAQHLSGS